MPDELVSPLSVDGVEVAEKPQHPAPHRSGQSPSVPRAEPLQRDPGRLLGDHERQLLDLGLYTVEALPVEGIGGSSDPETAMQAVTVSGDAAVAIKYVQVEEAKRPGLAPSGHAEGRAHSHGDRYSRR